jgi:hypothetical protein
MERISEFGRLSKRKHEVEEELTGLKVRTTGGGGRGGGVGGA